MDTNMNTRVKYFLITRLVCTCWLVIGHDEGRAGSLREYEQHIVRMVPEADLNKSQSMPKPEIKSRRTSEGVESWNDILWTTTTTTTASTYLC